MSPAAHARVALSTARANPARAARVCASGCALKFAFALVLMGAWRAPPAPVELAPAAPAPVVATPPRDYSLPLNGTVELDVPPGGPFAPVWHALVVDDSLLEVLNLPSCDDADVGFGASDTLRDVLHAFTLGRSPHAPDAPSYAFGANESATGPLRANSYFVAAALANASKLLPWWARELVKSATLLCDARCANVFISLFEEGSTDATRLLLEGLLSLLREMRVPAELNAPASDSARSARADGPVAAAAARRNGALAPLLRMALADVDAGRWVPTHVLLLDATYFCARGMLELLWPVLALPRSPPALSLIHI